MEQITYWIVFPILKGISKLPWFLFYRLSDITYFFLYYLIGYRKKVVQENLALSFPNKSIIERKKIEKKFYRHMCDLFLEMIKSLSMSTEETQKRYSLKNPELLEKLDKEGSFMIVSPHYANYEWGCIIDTLSSKTCVGVYKKIKNPLFEKLVLKLRSRYGSEVILNTKITKYTLSKEANPKEQGQRIYGLIIDQSPKSNKENYFVNFMGKEVPAFVGAEVLARKTNMPIVYFKISKVKRGYYEYELVPIEVSSSKDFQFPATHRFYELLEEQIYETPAYYLWTHKRWKHAR